ncbi:UNVERIFIED_CONTAM: hypothetical protein GTU68_001742, partial [Idotea baltica]|nr:hypothetical protein [Idotea baltica]
VGIGGSALGPQLLDDSFSSEKDPLKIFFIDNTDPVGINKTISSIPDISKTLAIIVSKSGGTKETRNGMKILESIWLKQKLDISKSFIAITGNNSKLFQHAKEHNWLEIFPIWDWVGGRTSLWSSVGLLPASLQGFDIEQLLAGASKMDELTRNQDCYNNPSMMMALVSLYCTNAKGEKDLIVIPYRDSLKLLSKYLQQLIMESLGKEKDLDGKIVNQGINVFGNKGSTDQHAYVQQLRDGLNNFYVAFIETKKKTNLDFDDVNMKVEEDFTSEDYLKGFSLGTKLALSDNNRKSLSIFLDEFSIYDFGSLLAFFERFVGFYAAMVNINAYDQPGVEAGKKAADRMLVLKKEVLNSITNKKKTLLTQLLSDFSNDYQESEVFEILNYLERNNIINSNRAQNLNEKEFFI